MAGTVGGLIQDALAGGIVGIGGLSKTLVGFLVGVLGAQFIVSQTVPRFVMFVGATVAARGLLPGAVRAGRGAAVPAASTRRCSRRRSINGLIGVLAFMLVERGPEMLQRRRARRVGRALRRFRQVLRSGFKV